MVSPGITSDQQLCVFRCFESINRYDENRAIIVLYAPGATNQCQDPKLDSEGGCSFSHLHQLPVLALSYDEIKPVSQESLEAIAGDVELVRILETTYETLRNDSFPGFQMRVGWTPNVHCKAEPPLNLIKVTAGACYELAKQHDAPAFSIDHLGHCSWGDNVDLQNTDLGRNRVFIKDDWLERVLATDCPSTETVTVENPVTEAPGYRITKETDRETPGDTSTWKMTPETGEWAITQTGSYVLVIGAVVITAPYILLKCLSMRRVDIKTR